MADGCEMDGGSTIVGSGGFGSALWVQFQTPQHPTARLKIVEIWLVLVRERTCRNMVEDSQKTSAKMVGGKEIYMVESLLAKV